MCDYSVLQYPLQWVEINVNIHEGKGLRQWPVEMFNSYFLYKGRLNCLFSLNSLLPNFIQRIGSGTRSNLSAYFSSIRVSPLQFENRIMARVYLRSITRSTMYQTLPPFC